MIGEYEREEHSYKVTCSCGQDNYIDVSLQETEDWSCFECGENIATVVGIDDSEKPFPAWTRIYKLPPVQVISEGD